MSNILAIAATTRALRHLLATSVKLPGPPGPPPGPQVDVSVTTSAPDLAGKNLAGPTLNLFLFHTVHNSAFSNMDMPRQVRPGESAIPPLALRLHYLLTAFGTGDTDPGADSHTVLAAAMSVLYDHPLLGAQELLDAYPGSDIDSQFERIRITPMQLSIDEISKLWSAFQTNYRLSVAYEVSVLLIDSRRPVKASLPVLRRGREDRGPGVGASAGATLVSIAAPPPNRAGRLGDLLVVTGENLSAVDTMLRFTSLLPVRPGRPLPAPIELAPRAGSAPGTLEVRLPGPAQDPTALDRWVPGFYTVALVARPDGLPPVASNEISFTLAPAITVAPNSGGAGSSAPGDQVALTCAPRLREGQPVLVIFGERQLVPAPFVNGPPGSPTSVVFRVPDAPAGLYLVRLRVEGVDSMAAMADPANGLPVFDPAQQVRV
jgi:hypothetical protein